MGYSVELGFNKNGEIKIQNLINSIKEKEIVNILDELGNKPHLCIAVYNDAINIHTLIDRLAGFRANSFSIKFSAISFFTGNDNCIFLTPSHSAPLYKLYDSYHKACEDFKTYESNYYIANNWVPHCTIADELTDMDFLKAIKLLHKKYKVIELEVDHISVLKFRPVSQLYSKKL